MLTRMSTIAFGFDQLHVCRGSANLRHPPRSTPTFCHPTTSHNPYAVLTHPQATTSLMMGMFIPRHPTIGVERVNLARIASSLAGKLSGA